MQGWSELITNHFAVLIIPLALLGGGIVIRRIITILRLRNRAGEIMSRYDRRIKLEKLDKSIRFDKVMIDRIKDILKKDGGDDILLSLPPSSSPPDDTEGHVSFIFEEADERRILTPDEGLYSDSAYRLQISLASLPDIRLHGQARTLSKAHGEEVKLQVAVISRSPDILIFSQALDVLTWTADGLVTPARLAFFSHAPGLAQFDVLIHRDCDLLFMGTINAEVCRPGARWATKSPIYWHDTLDDTSYRRTRPFRRFSRLHAVSDGPERCACIAIQRNPADGPDSFTMTVLVRTAELPVRAVFSRQELDANWLQIRGILDRLRRDPLTLDGGFDAEGRYTGSYAAGKRSYRHGGGSASERPISQMQIEAWFKGYLRDLALAGVSMRSNLFREPSHQPVYEALMRHTAVEGSMIQIWLDRSALDFAFPWHWLYDGPLDPQVRAEQHADPRKFWGNRLVIEQVADGMDDGSESAADDQIDVANGIRIRAGTYPFSETKDHLRLFEELSSTTSISVDFQVWNESARWKKFLPSCDAHLLYFFAHGHTAVPDTPAGVALRRLSQEVQMALALPEVDEESVPSGSDAQGAHQTLISREAQRRLLAAFQFLDSEGLWATHFIRLEQGNLKMEDLRTFRLIGSVRPLVILNMCESAQVYPSLTDGLINVFLSRGAIGVIGTEVSIPPQFGKLFGQRLLEGLAKGETVGQVLFELRREFVDNRNLLGFAYTLYGNANTRIIPALLQTTIHTGREECQPMTRH